MSPDTVVKVGGSLYDLPDLGTRLRAWLERCTGPRTLLVPGGGPAADWIRHLDAAACLGEEKSHWLALRALSFAAHVLAERLPGGLVISSIAEREGAWERRQVPILDMHAFALADEPQTDRLEHSWSATSDSFAARVAAVAGMQRLVLLKSHAFAEPVDWSAAARAGWVDPAFPGVIAKTPGLEVVAINFRSWQAPVSNATAPPGPKP